MIRSLDGRRDTSRAPTAIWRAATIMNPANITGRLVWSPAAEMWITPAASARIPATVATSRTASVVSRRYGPLTNSFEALFPACSNLPPNLVLVPPDEGTAD